MRAITTLSVTLSMLFLPLAAGAKLELPAKSPAASVMQRVGVTEITVTYSSPATNKRPIWGGLVPYDKRWRTGANANTLVTFTHPVTIAGSTVAAGKYSLFTVPGKTSWKVTLNSATKHWGTRGYDSKLDVASLTVKPVTIPARERMTFIFSGTTDTATSLDLEWAGLRVSIPIETATKKLALEAIDKHVQADYRALAGAARYLLENTKSTDQAVQLAMASLAVKVTWYGHWVAAMALHEKAAHAAARKHLKAAWELGEKSKRFFYREQVKKALDSWPAR